MTDYTLHGGLCLLSLRLVIPRLASYCYYRRRALRTGDRTLVATGAGDAERHCAFVERLMALTGDPLEQVGVCRMHSSAQQHIRASTSMYVDRNDVAAPKQNKETTSTTCTGLTSICKLLIILLLCNITSIASVALVLLCTIVVPELRIWDGEGTRSRC